MSWRDAHWLHRRWRSDPSAVEDEPERGAAPEREAAPERNGRERSLPERAARPAELPAGPDPHARPRAASLCIASGKGGTGKSVVCASLARLLARRGATLIVDADMGIGNAHILQGVSPERSFVEVVRGEVALEDIVARCAPGLDLLAAGSGVSRMAGLGGYELHLIAAGLERLEQRYANLIVDSAAGVSTQTVSFAAACDVVLVVTTPAVTAMTDAYAFLKVLLRARPASCPLMLVNRARDFDEAFSVAHRMESVTMKFLGRSPRWIGWIPEDEAVPGAVNERATVVERRPDSRAARALEELSVHVLEELARTHHRGMGRTLLRQVGYSPKAV